jgi:hypothetical protein
MIDPSKEMPELLIDIYNYVKELVKDIYPVKEDHQEWISNKTRWMMFPKPELESLEKAKSEPYPNVYIGISEDKKEIFAGISYDCMRAVETFEQLASSYNDNARKEILSLFFGIEKGWYYTIYEKTKLDYWANKPDYKEEKSWECNTVDDVILTKSLEVIKEVREKSLSRGMKLNGRVVNYQGPAINVMTTTIDLISPDFDKKIRDIFKVFVKCLQIMPVYEIEKEKNKEKEKFNSLHYLKIKEGFIKKDIKKFTRSGQSDRVEKLKSMLENIEKQIQEAEKNG